MSEIPESWLECKLGDVTDYGTTDKVEPEAIPESAWILELEDIEKDTSRLIQRMTFADRKSKSTKNRFRRGDVLYGKLRPYLNKVIRAPEDGFATTEIVPIPPNECLNGDYLFYWLKHPAFTKYVNGVSHGLNMPRLGTDAGKKAPFVLAPIAEQKRIADKLDSLLSRVDSCRERLDRVHAILNRFRQSVLAAAISGKLTENWRRENSHIDVTRELNERAVAGKQRRGVEELLDQPRRPRPSCNSPANWAWESAASLLSRSVFIDLKDGNHGSNHPTVSDFTEKGLPFITAAQVKDFAIDYEGAYKIEGEPLAKLRVGFAQKDDVILTHKGSVGRVAIADRNCVLTPQTTYYRLDQSVISPSYLMYYLASAPFVEQLDEIKSQTTRDFVPISQQYSLWHLIPPLPEQEEIVRRVSLHFTCLGTLEAACLRALEHTEGLTPSLLSKAFRGELVPQDPNDESASVLLEHIREQRQTIPANKPKRTTKLTPRAPKKKAAMTKSRFDEDVQGKPYLAGFLKGSKKNLTAEDLFKKANLPLIDFYKQLDFEVKQKMIVDRDGQLEAA
jgi:type I restriction enzyme S subunit